MGGPATAARKLPITSLGALPVRRVAPGQLDTSFSDGYMRTPVPCRYDEVRVADGHGTGEVDDVRASASAAPTGKSMAIAASPRPTAHTAGRFQARRPIHEGAGVEVDERHDSTSLVTDDGGHRLART